MPIRKHKDGYMVDVRAQGQRTRKVVRTKKEANALERELIAQGVMGAFPKLSVEDIAFKDFMPHYYEWAQTNKARTTVLHERYLIEANLIPFFGGTKLSAIDVPAIERFKTERKRDGVSNRSVNLDVVHLSSILSCAIRLHYASHNPVRDVAKLKETKKPPRYLSEEEVKRLLSAAEGTHIYPLILCALHTGMRKSELFNLKWSDIDFVNRTITIQPKEDWHTKNYSYRAMSLTNTLYQELVSLKERAESEYVFTYNGRQLATNVARSWRTVITRAGIQNCTLHTLRHSFASHLAIRGVPLMHIQQLMGHRDFKTTLIYAHLSQESVNEQVHKLPFGHTEES